MSASLDQLYFDWIYGKLYVDSVHYRPSVTFAKLFHILFTKEFVWLVPNDDNRVEDGKDIRLDFIYEMEIDPRDTDPMWMDLGCSVLEMLFGVAKRLEFQLEIPYPECFWQLLKNLRIDHLNDDVYIRKHEVNDILDTLIWRTYEPDGTGGLFPLKNPEEDQRKVEIWYQLNAYVNERFI